MPLPPGFYPTFPLFSSSCLFFPFPSSPSPSYFHFILTNKYYRFGSNGNTPSTTSKASSSTPYLNGRSSTSHDSYEEGEGKEGRRNGKTATNNNMYPPSPTANTTPRRRSTRVVKTAKPYPCKSPLLPPIPLDHLSFFLLLLSP